MSEGLTAGEITALAKVCDRPAEMQMLLAMAGLPLHRLPVPDGMTAESFWYLVGRQVAAGIIKDGRGHLLAAAHERYPDNPEFDVAPQRAALHVMVMGASPDGMSPVRTARELDAIQDAAQLGHLSVTARLSADISDLDRVLAARPDILHLACHGDGRRLFFEDVLGERHPVDVAAVAELLRAYHDHADLRLAGIVINACHSENAAVTLADAGAGDVVVAHAGRLEDSCAIAFASALYRVLKSQPALDAAARIAASQASGVTDGMCGSVVTGLRVRYGEGA